MKIVLLTNILTPYRKAFFDELNRQCLEAGDKFTVLVMAEGESNRKWTYDSLKESYTQLLSGKTIKVRGVDMHFNRGLKKAIKNLEPDLLIVAGAYVLPSAKKAAKLGKKLHIRMLFWSESHLDEARDYKSLTKSFRECVRKNFYKKFDGFLHPGQKAKDFIETYAKPGADYYCIPNLIDNTKFDSNGYEYSKAILRDKYGLSQSNFVFLSPIRLSKVKGMIPFLEMMSNTVYKSRVQIAIAGEGELEDAIKQTAMNCGIDIVLLGYRNEAQMIELYRCVDAFLLPSLSDPNPLTCIEALWSGLPMLVSNHVGNYPEVIRQGENGYMFSFENPKQALENINAMITSDHEWRSRASQISHDIAINEFEIKSRTKRLLDELKAYEC